MIKIKETKLEGVSGYEIYVDDSLISNVSIIQHSKRLSYELIAHGLNDAEKIISNLQPTVPPKVTSIEVLEQIYLKEQAYFKNTLKINLSNCKNYICNLNLTILPQVAVWKLKFSPSEYISKFIYVWNKIYGQCSLLDDFEWSLTRGSKDNDLAIQIILKFYELGEALSGGVSPLLSLIQQCHNELFEFNDAPETQKELFGVFSFPDEIKTYCIQYLLYFAKFLQDIGISATSNLKEDAGKVLFSITPTDDVEALDKIREALAIYLSLPSNPIPNSTGDRTVDMVLSGVRANAKHLESQLELAIAKLQFKEAALELKDATIEQHHLALRQKDKTIKDLQEIVARGNIFQESLERVEINGEMVDESSLYRFSREDDIEVEAKPVLEEKSEEARIGLVKFHEVTKLKDYGVSLDLPKAIRSLIDYFKRDRDKF